MDLRELRCKNCGGAIEQRTLKCRYCGSQYVREDGTRRTIYIQSGPPSAVPLCYAMRVSDEYPKHVTREQFEEICMKEITHELAKALVPYIKIETTRDFVNMEQIIKGTVRVVEPDFRF